jgi:hypothetical protein
MTNVAPPLPTTEERKSIRWAAVLAWIVAAVALIGSVVIASWQFNGTDVGLIAAQQARASTLLALATVTAAAGAVLFAKRTRLQRTIAGCSVLAIIIVTLPALIGNWTVIPYIASGLIVIVGAVLEARAK